MLRLRVSYGLAEHAIWCIGGNNWIDQFSRNIYRNRPQSFAYDPIALVPGTKCILQKFDQELTPIMRGFIYLPFMRIARISADSPRSSETLSAR